uniref:Phosphoserine phosphatase n=1 Tax=Canis lupus familiaris TaxID=9615 RepID=A0A8C0N146_CANLF
MSQLWAPCNQEFTATGALETEAGPSEEQQHSGSCSHRTHRKSSLIKTKILPRLVSHAELRKLFCSADAVWFEVDSTIIREDGIDELAKLYGVEDTMSEMAWQAMGGACISRLPSQSTQL